MVDIKWTRASLPTDVLFGISVYYR